MCGIAGCVGHENAPRMIIDGLSQVEYRGYDSAGIAFMNPQAERAGQLVVVKSVGNVAALDKKLTEVDNPLATTAIGHTRWATHGKVTEDNAHPHINPGSTLAVVHNGIIENHADLRRDLQYDGYEFRSQTDTEVIPHLIDRNLRDGMEPEKAFTAAVGNLSGSYAVLAVMQDTPGVLYAARKNSPLVLGVNGHEQFAGSDPKVWLGYTRTLVEMGNDETAVLTPQGYQIRTQRGPVTHEPVQLSGDIERAELGGHQHWMIKEIHDQPTVVRSAIEGRVFPESNSVELEGLESPEVKERLEQTERLIIVACGTSYHAGLIGERLIEEIAGLPVEVRLASEFQYATEPISDTTALLAISQSGETADTAAAVEKANELGLLTLGINNTPGSTIDKMTDASIHCRAGEEKSVASTKAFTSQVITMAELAAYLNPSPDAKQQRLLEELVTLPNKIEAMLADTTAIEDAAKKYAGNKNFMYIGRGYELPTAMEGALKLKEISYINANGIGAGELKHGSLALIDEDFPTFAIATDSPTYDKTVSNIREITSRDGPVVALATEGNEGIKDIVDDVIYVPGTTEELQPILNTVATQLFAYHVAVRRGLNVDRPRNLAKSVTVE